MSYLDLNQYSVKGYQFMAALHDVYTTWLAKCDEAQTAVGDGFDASELWAVASHLEVLLKNAFDFLGPIASNTASKPFLERTMNLAFVRGHLAEVLRKLWDPTGTLIFVIAPSFPITGQVPASEEGWFGPVKSLVVALQGTSNIVTWKPEYVEGWLTSPTAAGVGPGIATLLETTIEYSNDFYLWGSQTGDLRNAAAMTALGSQLPETAMIWVQLVDSAVNGAPLPVSIPMNMKSALAASVFLKPIHPKVAAAVTRTPFKTETAPPIINKLPPRPSGPTFHKGATNTGADSGGNSGGNHRPPAPGTEVTPVIPDEPCWDCNDFPPVISIASVPPEARPTSLTPLMVIGGAVVLGAIIAWRS